MNPSPSTPIEKYIEQEWNFAEGMNADTLAIARAIYTHTVGGRWLDIGCGPMLSIWPLFSKRPTEIIGLDRNREIRRYHKRLLNFTFEKLPLNIRDAYIASKNFRLSRGLEVIDDSRPLIREIKIQDLMIPISEWLDFFDTVIQIGCFGCLNSVEDLVHAIALSYSYLKKMVF